MVQLHFLFNWWTENAWLLMSVLANNVPFTGEIDQDFLEAAYCPYFHIKKNIDCHKTARSTEEMV